jgi:propionate CoA-transferase
MNKVMDAKEAVKLVKDGDSVAITGSGGGLLEAGMVFEALEKRFLETGSPSSLTLVHTTGLGDRKIEGINRFAHEGMVKRVIGGHWGWSPNMQKMANEGKIEAYNLPQGVMSQQYREIAAKRPGVVTRVGAYTFVDPRISGGKLNSATTEDIVKIIEIEGREWLFYKAYPIDIAIIRGTTADLDGNIVMDKEPAVLDVLAMAQAAKNSGGKVICQVKYIAQPGTLDPRQVKVPGIYVDAVVVNASQMQTVEGEYNPAFSGELKVPIESLPVFKLNERKVVARRALMELNKGDIINLGYGMPDGVASVAAEEGMYNYLTMTVEQGLIGGIPAGGDIFGVASNPAAILDEPSQFDFYSGNGLDVTCLGMAQVDKNGNVNVSKFGPVIAGCGGFIDISQSAKKVVFCGTFTAGGLQFEISDGKASIVKEGKHIKFIDSVEHITFSGKYAREHGQTVLYVTERAVFELSPGGLILKEIAPGMDIEENILQYMKFKPLIPEKPKLMDARIFKDGLMRII